MTFAQFPSLQDPTRYVGPSLATIPGVTNPRAPTITDRDYPLFTIWRNSDRTATAPDNEGDAWLLVRFRQPSTIPNELKPDAIWVKITTGSVPGGTLISLSDTANTKVFGDGAGNIQLVGGAGINIVSTPATNLLTVSLAGGGIAIDQINVDTHVAPGTDPVVPDGAGQITITGGQVGGATIGANVIQTASLAANSLTIEIQQTSSSGISDPTLNGVSHFNNGQFTVDVNGFVSLAGGGLAIDQINVDAHTAPGTDPVVPDGTGEITITGGQVANGVIGANVIRTDSLAANALTIEIQRSAAVAGTDSTINGVSHYNSAQFTVDANGFVSLTGGGMAIDSFTTDVAGPVTPDGAGNVAFTGSTSTYSNGTVANTLRTEVQGTNHAVFVGQGALTPATTITVGATGEVLAGVTGADPTFTNSISDGALPTFTFTSTTANVNRTLTVSNTDNTGAATSQATLQITTGGANVGDPKVTYTVTGANSFTTGIDNSASDSYTIAASTALGTTNTATCTTAGEWNYPLQPAFSAELQADRTNITGNATTYTIIYDNEIFDQNSDFNLGTSTFTAPVTGRYFLDQTVMIRPVGAAAQMGNVQITTSNRVYQNGTQNMGTTRDTADTLSIAVCALTDMDAADTAIFRVVVSGVGADTDGLLGSTSQTQNVTYAQGWLVA